MPTFCQLRTKSSTFWPWNARLESSEPVLPQVTSSLQMSLMLQVLLVRHQHLNCDEHTVLHNFDQNFSLKTKLCVGLVLLDVWTFLENLTEQEWAAFMTHKLWLNETGFSKKIAEWKWDSFGSNCIWSFSLFVQTSLLYGPPQLKGILRFMRL